MTRSKMARISDIAIADKLGALRRRLIGIDASLEIAYGLFVLIPPPRAIDGRLGRRGYDRLVHFVDAAIDATRLTLAEIDELLELMRA